ncbi:Uncharacterized protein BM_BM1169, partial [Brugia malayi]|uniref:Uncharacterized protein n=1 Tax=Brugia malayi TaxID=6279 RepID=A0A8L7SNA7_BRUMA
VWVIVLLYVLFPVILVNLDKALKKLKVGEFGCGLFSKVERS